LFVYPEINVSHDGTVSVGKIFISLLSTIIDHQTSKAVLKTANVENIVTNLIKNVHKKQFFKYIKIDIKLNLKLLTCNSKILLLHSTIPIQID
jgi:hypothetical protein